jgi:hypothetical protein
VRLMEERRGIGMSYTGPSAVEPGAMGTRRGSANGVKAEIPSSRRSGQFAPNCMTRMEKPTWLIQPSAASIRRSARTRQPRASTPGHAP